MKYGIIKFKNEERRLLMERRMCYALTAWLMFCLLFVTYKWKQEHDRANTTQALADQAMGVVVSTHGRANQLQLRLERYGLK